MEELLFLKFTLIKEASQFFEHEGTVMEELAGRGRV